MKFRIGWLAAGVLGRKFGVYCLFAAGLFAAANERTHAAIEIVAATGDNLPDGNGQLALHYAPTINAAGQIAFVSDLTGTSGGTADDQVVLRRDTSGGLTIIARKGESYAGQPIGLFYPPVANIDADGTVAR